jgi:hypothetical protein
VPASVHACTDTRIPVTVDRGYTLIHIRMYAHVRWVMPDILRWHATRGSSPRCVLPYTRTCACISRGMHRASVYPSSCLCLCLCLSVSVSVCSLFTRARTHTHYVIQSRARANTHHYRASWMKLAMPTCLAMLLLFSSCCDSDAKHLAACFPQYYNHHCQFQHVGTRRHM